jgi:hypothetical protein
MIYIQRLVQAFKTNVGGGHPEGKEMVETYIRKAG